MRMRCRMRVGVPLVQILPALIECVVLVGAENSSSSSLSQFASSTAAASAMSSGHGGYRDQRTWPALMPRARPLFCLTSLGMFAVVLVDDVRYQRKECRKSRTKAAGTNFVGRTPRVRAPRPALFPFFQPLRISEHGTKLTAWLCDCHFGPHCCCSLVAHSQM